MNRESRRGRGTAGLAFGARARTTRVAVVRGAGIAGRLPRGCGSYRKGIRGGEGGIAAAKMVFDGRRAGADAMSAGTSGSGRR
ncbi:hypothetical protein GCM10023107_88630 [Actinoplanes octamycinicus]|nr:hypothetical protein Aoc01nite_78340 [Actinoplanes octamycinicus]